MVHAGEKMRRALASPKATSPKKNPLLADFEQAPSGTRIFVKTSRGLLPIRVDLSWKGPEKIRTLLAEAVGVQSTWSLLFRGKVVFATRTLRDCGVELGSVLHLVTPHQPSSPFGARMAFRRGAFVQCDA
eukprot:TRINITY_DN10366_c0_g1_i3.p1 TRINITY_DN10366_c0_g1~~TRINITY_DN10366_c0_g1_i3.p1  ORF type:complete len:150 (-),score=17.70 TRINITY_DN10366_c0_g1_i3:559-948(-)